MLCRGGETSRGSNASHVVLERPGGELEIRLMPRNISEPQFLLEYQGKTGMDPTIPDLARPGPPRSGLTRPNQARPKLARPGLTRLGPNWPDPTLPDSARPIKVTCHVDFATLS